MGRFLAPVVGGSIIGALIFNPGLSFKAVYLVCGLTGVIALLFILRIPDHHEGYKKSRSWKETMIIFKTVAANRAILTTSAVEASILFSYGTFETFLPLYALQKKLTVYEVGIFLSSQVITLALTKPMMGRFSDRHGRRPQIFAGALIGAGCIGSFALFKTFLSLLVLSVLFGLSLSIVTSATSAFIADLSKPWLCHGDSRLNHGHKAHDRTTGLRCCGNIFRILQILFSSLDCSHDSCVDIQGVHFQTSFSIL